MYAASIIYWGFVAMDRNIVNRPGVARAVLQTASQLSVSLFLQIFIISYFTNCKS